MPIDVPSRLARTMPVFGWLRSYRREWVRGDVLAGLVVWAILIPEGMAYAQIAGLEPTALFYAAPWALLAYAAFGPSRRLVVVVSGAAAALSFATVAPVAATSSTDPVVLTAALALMAGAFSVLFGVLRLGFVSNFLSRPVMVGFIFGLAATIVMKQLPKLFGIDGSSGEFFERLGHLVRHLGDSHVPTMLVGFGALVLLVIWERHVRSVPGPLVVLAAALAVSALLGLGDRGVEVVGQLEGGLRGPSLPNITWDDFVALLPGAAGLALVVYAEGLGAAQSIAARHGEQVRADQELIGFGAANAASGWFQGFPIGVSLSKSAANDEAGANTQVAGVVAAALTIVTAFALTGLFTELPEAVLAAIVVFAIRKMFDVSELRRFFTLRRDEFWLAVLALAAVLVLDTLPGLILAVTCSMLSLAFRASRPSLTELHLDADHGGRWLDTHDGDTAATGLLVVRLDGPLWYASANAMAEGIREAVLGRPELRWVVLDLAASPRLDITSLDQLHRLASELRDGGRSLLVARAGQALDDQLERSGVAKDLGGVHATVESAVAATRADPASGSA